MLHGNKELDWGTPKPASSRSVEKGRNSHEMPDSHPVTDDAKTECLKLKSLDPVKKQGQSTKEHVIDWCSPACRGTLSRACDDVTASPTNSKSPKPYSDCQRRSSPVGGQYKSDHYASSPKLIEEVNKPLGKTYLANTESQTYSLRQQHHEHYTKNTKSITQMNEAVDKSYPYTDPRLCNCVINTRCNCEHYFKNPTPNSTVPLNQPTKQSYPMPKDFPERLEERQHQLRYWQQPVTNITYDANGYLRDGPMYPMEYPTRLRPNIVEQSRVQAVHQQTANIVNKVLHQNQPGTNAPLNEDPWETLVESQNQPCHRQDGITAEPPMQRNLLIVNTQLKKPSESSLSPCSSVASAKSVTSFPPVSKCGIIEADNKLEPLIKAKDDLIREKDIMIEKQKQVITRLRQEHLQMEEKLHGAIIATKSHGIEEEKSDFRVKELMYQISELKAKRAEDKVMKQQEIEKLQAKLGETEHELQKAQNGFNEIAKYQQTEKDRFKREVDELNQKKVEQSKHMKAIQDEIRRYKQKMVALKKYIEDLPTVDEYVKTQQKIKEVKKEKDDLQSHIDLLEKENAVLKNKIKSKDEELQNERKSKEDIRTEADRLSDSLSKYKEREKDGPVTLEEFEELKWEKERIAAERDRIVKMMERKHKHLEHTHKQAQKTIKGLEERLAQEEDTVNALRKEISGKENDIEDLRKSMKELSKQNQDLLSDNLGLKELLEEFEKLTRKEVTDMHRKVQRELALCISEIKSVVNLCSARAEGKDPNMSSLLGIKSVQLELDMEVDSSDPNPFSFDSAKAKLKSIRELRSEIDKLRAFVSDQYAEDVGRNCVTQ